MPEKKTKNSYLKVLLIEIYPDTQHGLLKKKSGKNQETNS